MRPAFRRGWEGEGKLNRCPGAGQRAKPATRGQLFCFGKREGKALGVPASQRTEAISLPPPQRGTTTAPLRGATPPDGVRAQLCASAHRARREARVPAGQLKNAAPSRSAVGKSATLKNPAHFPALPIVTRRAETIGLVRTAHRAGCRWAAHHVLCISSRFQSAS